MGNFKVSHHIVSDRNLNLSAFGENDSGWKSNEPNIVYLLKEVDIMNNYITKISLYCLFKIISKKITRIFLKY